MRNLIAATVALLCVLALSTEVLAQGVVVWHDSASMPGPKLNRGRNDIGQAQSLGGELMIKDGDKVYLCK